MAGENIFFNVSPKIVPSDMEATIKIEPLFDHCRFKREAEYKIIHTSMDCSTSSSERHHNVKAAWDNGALKVTAFFEGEQEHVISVFENLPEERKHLYSFHIYSLKEDLYERRPFKGDMHMHSYYSDGREAPAYVAAVCRRVGFDFMAVTDHRKYAPSVESQKAYESAEIDLKIFRGEEIHPPQNPVHMVNFGGDFSVNELFQDEKKYRSEVKAIEEKISAPLSDDERYQYASCVWCFDRIREGGGLGIYCHPHWVYSDKYNVSSGVNAYMFENQPFDAYEILGGYFIEEANSNILQVAYYNEERAKGRSIPIVGVSDAHGCERGALFGWYYTIVFSEGLMLPEIIEGIKELYSVAVEALPGEPIRVYGPYRLVKYALFLIREIFPRHDEMCRREGEAMIGLLRGDEGSSQALSNMKGQCGKLMEDYWGHSSTL